MFESRTEVQHSPCASVIGHSRFNQKSTLDEPNKVPDIWAVKAALGGDLVSV
jgi:hypothetical protein